MTQRLGVSPSITHILQKFLVIYQRIIAQKDSWLWKSILIPYLATRSAFVLCSIFGVFFVKYPNLGDWAQRGWWFTANKLLDIWARWDSGWYLGIVQSGYQMRGDYHSVQNSIVFFPVYPYLIKFFLLFLPQSLINPKIILFIGVILSNLFLVGALILLFRLAEKLFDRDTANRSVWYLILFPSAFIFSCFYTESTFLFFSLAAWLSAIEHRWFLASISGVLVVLTRPTGMLLLVPLALLYFYQYGWSFRRFRLNVLWLTLIPIAFFGYLYILSMMTGDIFAPFVNQNAWYRSINIFENLISIARTIFTFSSYSNINVLFVPICLILGILAFWKFKNPAYGLYTLSMLFIPLSTGSFTSLIRYILVIFPIFVLAATLVKNRDLDTFIKMSLFTLQVILILGWLNLYFAV